ncbi:zinc finger BED domain-containing protein 4-like [Hydra vulgaris]|uniref:zinc finger BED domain-containing protein 4-like n=1 Tax=Hydra vulgaris TaxID=6087 RepID=UPI001F5F0CB0|nr:zinc finger BED domain-containing protein 4-like [Hydra vulgaris]
MIKRGTMEAGQKCFSTTPLHNHIKINHPKEYHIERNKNEQKRKAQAVNKITPEFFSTSTTVKKETVSETSKQTSIDEYLKSQKVWSINDSRSQTIHRKIGLMMALDKQPFTLVEDTAFLQIWTCPISHESFISLSSHSIDKDFNRFDVVLHASHFPESHTGINISKKLESMWDSWKIQAERRHILVRDVVSDSISENIVIDILSKCRRLVTHFNHSSLARNNFKQIQLQQNLDPLCLVQDVPTRWNSTYLMLDRLNKLKIPVQLYLAERSDLMPFSTLEWTLILNIIKLLKPFFQLTQEMSSEITTLSSVIPNMCSLKKFISKCQVDLSIQETKNWLTTSLKNRFFSEINDAKSLNILKNRYYVIATSIDPRYKFSFFEDDIKKQAKY